MDMTNTNTDKTIIMNSNTKLNRYTLGDLKILSWNIQSTNNRTGTSKFKDQNFMDIIKNGYIICLQEIRQASKVIGFRSFTNTRKSEKDGGVSILIRNSIKSGVKRINCEEDDIIICQLKKSFFKFENDIFVINAYITPNNSSGKNKRDGKEMLSKISDLINELSEKGNIILCGDYNARISDHPCLIQHDDPSEHISLPDDYVPNEYLTRNSKDKHKNSFATDFITTIMNNNLNILNGRTLGDLSGSFTCIKPSGSSVVDYMAVTPKLNPNVTFFEVLPFTRYSDHRPIQLTLKTNELNLLMSRPINEIYEPAPSRFLFNDHSKRKFADILNNDSAQSKLNEIQSLTSHIADRQTDRQEIIDLNDKYVTHLQNVASSAFKITKKHIHSSNKNRHSESEPWFNHKCREAKRNLNKAARAVSNNEEIDFLRLNFYHVKKFYNTLITRHKNEFFDKMNKDIENGKILNWQQFKKLKKVKAGSDNYDSLDMKNFEEFFSNLYADEHATVNADDKRKLINEADNLNSSFTPPSSTNATDDFLNCEITIDETRSIISSLKIGKASSDDMIANDILKLLNDENITFLTNLFNICLDKGVYPWNTNIITPLHKKGSKDDPDNYRAIAVSSVIGKLFSTILLERLIRFRKIYCPDASNQLGFTKGAQTYDHILTIQTIAAKYKKLNQPVFAIFVDFKKAFDSICRQALFSKLAKSNIKGKFYSVLRDMYSHSSGQIKLSGYISKTFDINKGTEQGHPLSPDLFKIYLSDLSPLLEFENCPTLANTVISHLLWADDLIMVSLDKHTAQKQLDTLNQYCIKWGIEVNVAKTKVMIMGSQAKIHYDNINFKLGTMSLELVDSYCYLGIVIHKSGSLKLAQSTLKTKAMRAFFGLKGTINRAKISFRAKTTLFDSLIKPILLYGAPIWLPTSPIVKSLSSSVTSLNRVSVVNKISRMDCEASHLSFLKWALGVHRKASNIGTWGETGRYPLVYQSIKLTLKYFKRIESMKVGTLVHAAYQEQKNLKLPWYKNLERILKLDKLYDTDHVSAYTQINSRNKIKSNCSNTNSQIPHNFNRTSLTIPSHLAHLKVMKPVPCNQFRIEHLLKILKDHFVSCWSHEKSKSSKLAPFYNKIKCLFQKENYLDLVTNTSFRYKTTQLRISAHDLEIEQGRYRKIPRNDRICKWCSTTLNLTPIESENHFLFHCEHYLNLRIKLIETINKCSDLFPREPITTLNLETFILNIRFHPVNQSSHSFSNESPPNSIQTTSQQASSCLANAIATYIGNSFKRRWLFKRELLDIGNANSNCQT